ncbi:MAG: hypothetical protein V2G42_04345 [bacterium JZ-2024 1]
MEAQIFNSSVVRTWIPLALVLGYAVLVMYATRNASLRRWLAVALAFGTGLFMAVQFFTTTETPAGGYFNEWYQRLNKWAIVVAGLTVILAVGNIVRLHLTRVIKSEPGWGFSVLTLFALVVTTGLGIISIQPAEPGKPWYLGGFMWIFSYALVPLDGTMFSLLAFYMASAAYRAFRARNFEASLMLTTAIIVMLGRVPVGAALSSVFPSLTAWILQTPNLAAQRGIMIGVALGVVATSLKIILGVERPYLGGAR